MREATRTILASAFFCVGVTMFVWITALPDEPPLVLEDVTGSALSAFVITLVVSRRSTWLK